MASSTQRFSARRAVIALLALVACTQPENPSGTNPPPSGGPALAIPSSANAPWWTLRRVDALNASAKSGMNEVWGAYFERSEEPFEVMTTQQTKELGMTSSDALATYPNVDLGSGVEAFVLRVSTPTAAMTAEIRSGSATGTLLGKCALATTGAAERYVSLGCPTDPKLAVGRQTVVVRFIGANADARFNWFAYWARDTKREIDALHNLQNPDMKNAPAPTPTLAGTPARSRAMLPASDAPKARSYGAWTPAQPGDCPQWMHDTYWTKGDDGKVYPTWHPSVDYDPDAKQYCTYAHEHGDDPRGSSAFAVSGLPPFGYVNEQLAPLEPSRQRNEDHVGHKVRVANGWNLYDVKTGQPKRCNLVFKIHMGTHSPDALTNTAHELFVAGQCEGSEAFNTKSLALFGAPGSFKHPEGVCATATITPGITPTPNDQPNGGVHRQIPSSDCYAEGDAATQTQNALGRTSEFWLTGIHYFIVKDPSRFFDAASSTKIGRTVDLCRNANHPLAATQQCQEAVAAGSNVAWNDPRSPFRGTVTNNTHFSTLQFADAQATTLYTDAYARTWLPVPDASKGITVQQRVPRVGFHYAVDGHDSLFPYADYSAGGTNGVRAPN